MIFEENYEPISVTIKNVRGEEFTLDTKLLTTGELKEIEEIGTKKSKEYKTEADKLFRMMEIIFGKGEEFFSQFSAELLTKVNKYVLEEVKKKQIETNG